MTPKKTNQLAPQEWPEKLRFILESSRFIFERDHSLVSVVFAWQGGGMRSLEKMCLYIVADLMRGQKEKDVLAVLMRKIVEDGTSTIALLTECWFLRSKDKNSITNTGSLEHHPDRLEGVAVRYESDTHTINCIAEITRPPDSEPVLGEWKVLQDMGDRFPGSKPRFADIKKDAMLRVKDRN